MGDGDRHVLIVEDMLPNALLAAALVDRLEGVKANVHESGAAALAWCADVSPDLILLDYHLPDMTGTVFLERLSEIRAGDFVPVIVVTGETDPATLHGALDAGATDVLRKPWDEAELSARVRCMLRLRNQHLELQAANAALERLANTDPLTGVRNRRAFLDQAMTIRALAARHNRDLAMVMLDIDHFKRINDSHGHAAGGSVLVEFAHRVAACLRQEDVLGRLGGEEFEVLLPETTPDGATVLAERVRERVAAAPMLYQGVSIPVTVSIGVAPARQERSHQIDSLMMAADEALYAAKAAGRNRVVICAEQSG